MVLRSGRLGGLIGTGIRVRKVELSDVGQHLGDLIEWRLPRLLDQALAVFFQLGGLRDAGAAVILTATSRQAGTQGSIDGPHPSHC